MSCQVVTLCWGDGIVTYLQSSERHKTKGSVRPRWHNYTGDQTLHALGVFHLHLLCLVSGLGINSNDISSSLMQCLQLASRIAQPPPLLLLFFLSSPMLEMLEGTRPSCLTQIPSLFALTSLESHMASWHSMPSLCQEHEYLSFQPTSPFWTPHLYIWVSCHLQSSSSWTWQSPSRHPGLPRSLNLLHTQPPHFDQGLDTSCNGATQLTLSLPSNLIKCFLLPELYAISHPWHLWFLPFWFILFQCTSSIQHIHIYYVLFFLQRLSHHARM